MNKDVIKTLVSTEVEKAGGSTRKGFENAARVIESALDKKDLPSKKVSLRALYDATVDTSLGESAQDVAEAISSSAFPVISSKLIHRDIIRQYDLSVGDVSRLVRETEPTNSTSRELVAGIQAGSSEPLLRREGEAYKEAQFGEKNWQIQMADFGRMISITRETIKEDRTGEVMNYAQMIGRAAGQHKAKMIIQTLEGNPRDAFEESSFKGAIYKGQELTKNQLYSDDHSGLDGQVNDNLAEGNPLVDYRSIDNIMQLFAKMTDEGGHKISITPRYLVVPNALKVTAWNIMNTISYAYAGDGGDSSQPRPTTNPISAIGDFEVIGSIWLSSDSDYYLGDMPSQLQWINVFPPETASQGADSELAFTNQIVSRFRFSYHAGLGHTDYRWIIRSKSA